MQTNLSFLRTLAGPLRSHILVDVWDKVLSDYETGKFADSIRDCLNYINPEIEKKFANADRTEYNVPHGSVIVQVKITDTDFSVTAPFLSIEGAKLVPILRQVAQLNFTPLTIARIELDGDKLYFRYSCPLSVAEPYKIYDVLREICINADNYDDEFIHKFGAKRIQEPKIYGYTDEQKLAAWDTVQKYIKETFEAYEQLENKRLNTYLWDVLVITILKIDYYCAPQGSLRSEMEKTLAYLNSKDDYYQRLSSGKDFLKKLQAYDKARFENDLYRIDVFVPYKFRTNLESVRNSLKYAYETSEKEMKAMDFIGATCTLEYGILNLFYSNNVEDEIADVLTKAMEEASAKPMQDAARILFDAVQKIMKTDSFANATPPSNTQQTSDQREKKGFFSKLFGS
jgi:hypothetical protein